MATLDPGQTASIYCNSRTVKGISVRANVVSNAVNTPQINGNFDPSKVQVRVTAKRGGKEVTLYSGNLQTWAAASTIGKAGFSFANPSATGEIGITTLAAAVAAAEVRLYPLYLDFGSIVDGKLGEVTCTLQSNGNEYSAANLSNSSITFDFEEGNGTEFFTPNIVVQSVSANESSREYALGSMVKRVVFVNYDKTDKLTASNVLTMANFSSDEYATNDNWNALQAKACLLMSEDDFNNIAQSVILINDRESIPATNAAINCQFETTNVNGGKNYIVSWGGHVNRSPQAAKVEYVAKVSKPYVQAVARIQRSVVS